MIILLLLRRMSRRARTITGWTLLGLAIVVAAASAALSINLYIHAIMLAACAAVFLWAPVKQRDSRTAATTADDRDLSRVA
jgi:ABC-type Mn2+/Zn2+ transport system permease subunit